MADVETKYVANIIPYLEAQKREERGGTLLAESVMLKLIDRIKGKRYNITCDYIFTLLVCPFLRINDNIFTIFPYRLAIELRCIEY